LEIGIPSESSRLAIFRGLLDKVSHNIPIHELEQISNQAHGFVGADISLLIKEAILLMMKNKTRNVLEMKDLLNAFSFVKPSALREVLTTHPFFAPHV
jgi:AAA family ATPase